MTTQNLPNSTFKIRSNISGSFKWITKTTNQIFTEGNYIIFSLPGAFTPTCSTYQLPDFEKLHNEFKEYGITSIYCISVNDAFVMNAWGKHQNIKNITLLPDGNGEFTRKMGMLVEKNNLGFGMRSWRYAVLTEGLIIKKWFNEPGYEDNIDEDPYGESSPQNILEYLRNIKKS